MGVLHRSEPLSQIPRDHGSTNYSRKTHLSGRTSMIFGADVHDPKGSRKMFYKKVCSDFWPLFQARKSVPGKWGRPQKGSVGAPDLGSPPSVLICSDFPVFCRFVTISVLVFGNTRTSQGNPFLPTPFASPRVRHFLARFHGMESSQKICSCDPARLLERGFRASGPQAGRARFSKSLTDHVRFWMPCAPRQVKIGLTLLDPICV